jgi:hypothetical protein
VASNIMSDIVLSAGVAHNTYPLPPTSVVIVLAMSAVCGMHFLFRPLS